MTRPEKRGDRATAEKVKEALAMQRAFGDVAATRFLEQRGISSVLVQRVLSAPPDRRRY